jgi:hypothetical protein
LESVAASIGIEMELWVVSAGYGLIGQFDLLKPYAAAFSQGQVDSVAPTLQGSTRRRAIREWWNELSHWPRLRGSVRSLEDLARKDPEAPMLVALSAPYLDAVMDDLLGARREVAHPNLLLVVSAGVKCAGGLAENVLPATASLQHAVGGSLHSLNVRIARWILSRSRSHRFERRLIERQLRGLAVRSAPEGARTGQRVSDSDVKAFVRERLGVGRPASRSALLRQLRRAGKSCEQARFNRIFSVVLDTR